MTTVWTTTPLNFKHKDSAECCIDELKSRFDQRITLSSTGCVMGENFDESLGEVISGFVWGSFAIKTASKAEDGTLAADVHLISANGEKSYSVELGDLLEKITPNPKSMVLRIDCSHPLFINHANDVQKDLQEKINSGEITEQNIEAFLKSMMDSEDEDQALELQSLDGHFAIENEFDPQDYHLVLNFK